MRDLPSGILTFLFTDIEGSTRLLRELGDRYAGVLSQHRRLLRDAFERHGGFEVGTEGDAFFVVFKSASDAVAAAGEGQAALEAGPVRVRMGLHTGEPVISEGDYVGLDVHLAARIAACAHGSQVVLSAGTQSQLGDGVSLTYLGEHRLKDFDEPVRLYQLGKDRFPPLRTISNTNLPRPVSSFVGREREVAELVSILRNGARLVTLTGPGGSGKTRLAIEAAGEVVPELKAGVFWVGLAQIRDPALVTETIAQTLGAKDSLAEHIAEREMLLLLDNFEQVVDAAPELSSLLATCHNLRLLITSRELLRVQGEREYAVPPLAETEAVQLFCARSRLQADEVIAEICRRLDDLPLAVELAAARTSVLTPTQILGRLSNRLDLLKGGRDLDPRQVTLRATIEWSFDLLSDREKELLARLAIFSGCTLEAAEAVAGADVDTLQSLVEKSLVRRTGDRFWMLETIREFAAERLQDAGEADDLRNRHAQHFLALTEESEPHTRADSREWLDRLEEEVDNLRGALDWFEASGDGQSILRMAGAADDFWCAREHLAEGRRRLDAGIRMDTRPHAARAKALAAAAHLARDLGDTEAAKLQAEEALTLHRELGNTWGAAYSLFWLGQSVADEGDFARARDFHQQGSQLFHEAGDESYALLSTRMIAWALYELGDREQATKLHEENLRRARALGDRSLEASTLGALASYAAEDGRADEAIALASQSLRIYYERGSRQGVANELCRCAAGLARARRAATATRLLACSAALWEEFGGRFPPYLAAENEKTLAVIHSQLDQAAFNEAWEQGHRLTMDEAVGEVLKP